MHCIGQTTTTLDERNTSLRPDTKGKMTNRALPGHITDLIAFGITETDDRRPLFNAVTRVAMSAVRRGWTKAEWRGALEDGLREPKKKDHHRVLWHQITHRRRRHLAWPTIHTFLDKIWNRAVTNVSQGYQQDPLELAERWETELPQLPLTRAEQLVLRYVITEVRRRGFRKVTCPGREVAKACGVSHQTAVDALKVLRTKGYIVCIYRGLGNPRLRMAAIYCLSDADSLLGSPTVSKKQAPEQPSSTSTSTHHFSLGRDVYYQGHPKQSLYGFGAVGRGVRGVGVGDSEGVNPVGYPLKG